MICDSQPIGPLLRSSPYALPAIQLSNADRVKRTNPGPEHNTVLSAAAQQQVAAAAACREVTGFGDCLVAVADPPVTGSLSVHWSRELPGRGLFPSLVGEALPGRVQHPRGMNYNTPKAHTKKVVYQTPPTSQVKGEPELLRKEVPHSSGKIQKPPKRSSKSEPRHPTLQSDGGTPDSLPDSGSTDEYRALRRQYLMLEEENFALDNELNLEDEEINALEDEKSALLDQLVVLEGLVDPSEMQPQRRL